MFGLGKGKMELEIQKRDYAFGETMTGKVRLDLKKATKADGVFIIIKATQEAKNHGREGTHKETIYENKKELDAGREYTPQAYEYDFEIPVPRKEEISLPDFIPSSVLKAASFLSMGPKWEVIAKLDVPGGMDVSKGIKIQVL